MIQKNLLLTQNQILTLFFIGSIISRVLSSIFYIEDIDSLRFGLSLYEYNISKLQPHFPGYPIFSFVAKCIYFFIDSMGITFSLIGGLSIFSIIYFSLKITKLKPNSYLGIFISFFILLNPLMWLMSNRYMPDLMGLAIMIGSFYYLTKSKSNIFDISAGFFLFGILAGIRLSYIPFLLMPIIICFIYNRKKFLLILTLLLGFLIWLVPLIYFTGFNELWLMALQHTQGHFNDYGGTIYTEHNWWIRFTSFFRSIWADGFAGFWIDRSWITLIISLYLIYYFFQSIKNFRKILENNSSIKIIIYSIIIYSIWVFLFQNVIYKSRHIMPIVLILIILLSLGQKYFKSDWIISQRYLHLSFISFLFMVSLVLILQHKKPTAIAQTKNYLINKEQPITIVTIPLIDYYLRTNGIKTNFINIENKKVISEYKNSYIDKNHFMIGDFKNLLDNTILIKKDTTFFHNPYVNRMWSQLNLYSLNTHNLND